MACFVKDWDNRASFFEDERRQKVTVNSEQYVAMLQNFFIPYLEENEWDIILCMLYMYNMISHSIYVSTGWIYCLYRESFNECICEIFAGCLVSRSGDIPWPSRSPDLSLSDFFLWGHQWSKVYQGNPRTIPQLK